MTTLYNCPKCGTAMEPPTVEILPTREQLIAQLESEKHRRIQWEHACEANRIDFKQILKEHEAKIAAERERREKAERTMLRALAPDPALAAARAEIERLRAEAALERGDYASSAVERELRASLIEEQKANNRLQRELDEVRSRSNQVPGVIRGGIIDFSGAPQTRSSTTTILPTPQTKDPLALALMRVPLPNDRGEWFLYEENAMRLAAALRSGLISEELKEINGRLAALQVTANELASLLDATLDDVPGHKILRTKIRDALRSYREKYPC